MLDFKKYSENFIIPHDNEIPAMLSGILNNANTGFSILDLGCGDGALLTALRNQGYFNNAVRIVGVDLSPERIDRLRNISNFELICSDAGNVKHLENGTFDYVLNTQVIEHVPDDKALLVEIYRLLKNDGTLYISSVIKRKYGWYIYRCKNKWVLDPTHLREYCSEKEFISLIESVGFKVVNFRVTLHKFSPVDFLIRRIYFPIFRPNNINSLFQKSAFLKMLRVIKIPVIGYHIIEVIALNRGEKLQDVQNTNS